MSSVLSVTIGQMRRKKSLVIGEVYGGGYYAGIYNLSGTNYNLVISPKTLESGGLKWLTGTLPNATKDSVDGVAATNALFSAGSPAADFVRLATTGGYSDWYLPSVPESAVLNSNLNPVNTSVLIFKTGGAQAIGDGYWTSTYSTSLSAPQLRNINAAGGLSSGGFLSTGVATRGVRRVAV